MKRLLLMLLCVLLPFSVTACVGSEPTVEESASVSESGAAKSTTGTTTTTTETTQSIQAQQLSDFALAQADYQVDKSRIYSGYSDGMTAYYRRVLPAFLAGKAGENRVCSPLNIYLALCMLAETTDGNTRAQLLELLCETDIEGVRQRSAALWNSQYKNTETAKCLLANSLWMNETSAVTYRQSTVQRLAEDYYASVFRGKMGSTDYDAALHTWINDNTGGLLKEQASGERFDAAQLLSLVSTVYYKTAWERAFDGSMTVKGNFRTAAGEVSCEYMQDTETDTYCYRGSEFTAVNRPMQEGFSMWFVLPNEGVGTEQLLNSAVVTDLMADEDSIERVDCDLVMKIPKFDVTHKKGLIDDLEQLGVTDVFQAAKADLSGIFETGSTGAYVTGVNHAVRILVEEKGVEAAAYTGITVMKGDKPPKREVVYFFADRPFLFAVTGPGNALLFAGVLENPTEK